MNTSGAIKKIQSQHLWQAIEIGKGKEEKTQVKTKYLRKQTIPAAEYAYESTVILISKGITCSR